MSTQSFKSRLTAGEQLLGTMITLPCPSTAEILSEIGFDWFFIDGEHGPLGTQEILAILQTVSHRVSCVVRVPEASEVAIKKVLDIGAHGIIVPQVNTARLAESVVTWAKYPPEGSRGVGLARAHHYGSQFKEYVASANDEISVIVQTEHITAVQNIEQIVDVKGIDAIQLGPYDLSASMDLMGQVTHPKVSQAIDTICRTAKRANLPIGCFGVTAADIQRDRERGASLICLGTDSLFLTNGASHMFSELKRSSAVED